MAQSLSHLVHPSAPLEQSRGHIADNDLAIQRPLGKQYPYHTEQLQNALDDRRRFHLLPPFPGHERVLDVGCGMGQTLIAARLEDQVQAWGLDIDDNLIHEGKKIAPAHINLLHGTGEAIPFPDGFFDLVFSRVSLPYMEIRRALSEMHRTLARGGDVWLVLHARCMYTERLKRSFKQHHVKDTIYCLYILTNGVLFNRLGIQFPFVRKRMESYQTPTGIRRALERAGFTNISFLPSELPALFLVSARKA